MLTMKHQFDYVENVTPGSLENACALHQCHSLYPHHLFMKSDGDDGGDDDDEDEDDDDDVDDDQNNQCTNVIPCLRTTFVY